MKTDNELRADVEAQLAWDPGVDNRNIVVAVKNGIVALAGHVPTYADKWAAEKAAKGVSGVRAIINEMDVHVLETVTRADKDIAAAALTALKSHVTVPASDLQVIVRDGCITLEGKVALWFQKDAAERAVRELWGVKSIVNNIELKPRAHPGEVKGKIHQAYKRHASLDADKIQVEVAGGTVTLGGEVHSWHERDDAEIAAYAAPGVTSVRNNLTVRI